MGCLVYIGVKISEVRGGARRQQWHRTTRSAGWIVGSFALTRSWCAGCSSSVTGGLARPGPALYGRQHLVIGGLGGIVYYGCGWVRALAPE